MGMCHPFTLFAPSPTTYTSGPSPSSRVLSLSSPYISLSLVRARTFSPVSDYLASLDGVCVSSHVTSIDVSLCASANSAGHDTSGFTLSLIKQEKLGVMVWRIKYSCALCW